MISSTIRRAGPYSGNGSTTAFAFGFKVFAPTDVAVTLTDAAGNDTTLTTGYSVALNSNQDITPGGTVNFANPPLAGTRVTLISNVSAVQPMQLTNGGGFFPRVLNDSADRHTILIQQLQELANRSVKLPVSDQGQPPTLPSAAARAGKALVGLPDGSLGVAALGPNNDPGLRGDLANVAAGAKLMAYRVRTANAKFDELLSAYDMGALGNAAANDYAALQALLNASDNPTLPPGRFYIGSNKLRPHSGQTIRGAGKTAWEPYLGNGNGFPTITRTEIIVDAGGGWDLHDLNSVKVEGVTVRARTGTQSTYYYAPGFVAGTIGFDITHSSQVEIIDCALLGLETGVGANLVDGTLDTQMPHISRIMASDCDRVIRFGTPTATAYTTRDPRIDGITIALHCNVIVEAHRCDGIRIEHCRFFQAKGNSIYIRSTNFGIINGVTTFETGDCGIFLNNCQSFTMSATQIVRAGAYSTAPSPNWPAYEGLKLVSCKDVSFEGQIEEVTGAAALISSCIGTRIHANVRVPWWTNGAPANTTGAINVLNSSATHIDMVLTEQPAAWVAVWADTGSSTTLTGRVTSEGYAGVVRAYGLQPDRVRSFKNMVANDTPFGASGAIAIGVIRMLVPAGKKLKTRSVFCNVGGFTLRDGSGQVWQANISYAEAGGGTLALDDKTLFDNSAGSTDVYAQVNVLIHNTGAAGNVLPAGAELYVSTVLV